jgi:hypothetical protein
MTGFVAESPKDFIRYYIYIYIYILNCKTKKLKLCFKTILKFLKGTFRF